MWEEILAFLSREWIGLLASVFVLISFLFSNELKTRIINLIGCIIWVVCGIVVKQYSISFMNSALIIVHIVKLVNMYMSKRKQVNGQIAADGQSEQTAPQQEEKDVPPQE